MKYARIERERRFRLSAEDADALIAGKTPREIEDRYLHGTRFRLRCIRQGGKIVQRKLTQKYLDAGDAANGTRTVITSTYLTQAEYDLFAALPAHILHKMRYTCPLSNEVTAAVDLFRGPLTGLILAEVEFESDEALAAFVPPPAFSQEVTSDERFRGGALCLLTTLDSLNR